MGEHFLIGIITPQYWPSRGPSAIYFHALVHGLSQLDCQIWLFCTGAECQVEGPRDDVLATVVRFGSEVNSRGSRVSRLKRLMQFHLKSFLEVFKKKNHVSVWIIDGPLYWNLGAILGALIGRTRFLYLVHDLYPEVLVRSRILRKGFLFNLLSRVECYPMRKAQAVLTLSEGMVHVLRQRLGEESQHVGVLPFPVDPLFEEHFAGNPSDQIPNPPVLLYAGGIGVAHYLKPFCEWAMNAKNNGDLIRFRLVTDYTHRRIRCLNQDGIEHQEPVSWAKLPNLYRESSAGFIGLPPAWGDTSLPSKLFSIFASGRPVVAVADSKSAVYQLVRNHRVGIVLTHEESLTIRGYYRVVRFLNSNEEIKQSGSRARSFIRERHFPRKVAQELMSKF